MAARDCNGTATFNSDFVVTKTTYASNACVENNVLSNRTIDHTEAHIVLQMNIAEPHIVLQINISGPHIVLQINIAELLSSNAQGPKTRQTDNVISLRKSQPPS